MKPIDTDLVRQLFPAFDAADKSNPAANSSLGWAFFENAGGTYPARSVVERLNRFYMTSKVQPYGHAPMQHQAGVAMDAGRQAVADILGVDSSNIALGPSTTQNFNTLAAAFSGVLKQGDEVIVSEQDHEANIGAWIRNAERCGALVKFWQVDSKTGQLSLDDLGELLNPRTRLVSVTHSSNIIGQINPLPEISALVHKAGAVLIADGVSYAPHGLPDLSALGVDAYCFSTYKTFGTHMGVLYVSDALVESLAPQCHYFNEGKSAANFDAAGPDHASIAALAGLKDYFEQLHEMHAGDQSLSLCKKVQQCSHAIKAHEQMLVEPVLELLAKKAVRIFGSPTGDDAREANIALASDDISSAELNQRMANFEIAVGNGHFYAPRVLDKMGVRDLEDGVLRISFAHYNSAAEIERLLDALDNSLD